MRIDVSDAEEAARRAGHELTRLLLLFQNSPILLLLSGGSALSLLSHVAPQACGPHVTLCLLDERAHGAEASNQVALTRTSFYAAAYAQKVHVIDSGGDVLLHEGELGDRFREGLSNWKKEHPRGAVLATFGIGTDGHVAGIMPYPENPPLFLELFETNEVAVGYVALGKNQFPRRATVTLPFIRLIDGGVAYVIGEGKRSAVERVIFRNALASTPAAILAHLPHVTLYTDITGLPVVE